MVSQNQWTRAQLASLRTLRNRDALTHIVNTVIKMAQQGYTCISVEVPTIMIGEDLRKVFPDSEIVCRFETTATGHVRRVVDICWN
jgi:hypothetical protein